MRIKQELRYEEVIKKSRFIACLMRVSSEEEARAYIESIRKEFRDASHVCTAYVIEEPQPIQRSSDNHEPAGTAGVPILESILHSGVTDLCVCVVRYFGGVKLGAGGLIRAYSGVVTTALSNAEKTIDVEFDVWKVTYPYTLSGTLEGWLRQNVTILDLAYAEEVTCTFETTKKEIPDKIRDLSRGVCIPEFIQTSLHETDLH